LTEKYILLYNQLSTGAQTMFRENPNINSGIEEPNSIIDEYLRRLKKIRPDLFRGDVLADETALKRLHSVRIEYNDSTKNAQTYLNANIITIGRQAQNKEILLFHELEHVRKGEKHASLYPFEGCGISGHWNGDKINLLNTYEGETTFSVERGLFFDEAITEMIAQCLYLNKEKSQVTYDFVSVRQRYGDKIKLLVLYANALDISPIDLCRLIESRMFHCDTKIERLTRHKKLDYKMVEKFLDCSATVVMLNTQCENKRIKKIENGKEVFATGCDEETTMFAECQKQVIERALKIAVQKRSMRKQKDIHEK